MNVEHAPTASTESRERHSSARLQGRWLLLARGVWLTLYFLTLALLVLVFLLFPNGQFVPRWTRWTFVVFLVGQIPSTFFPGAPFMLNTNASLVGFLMLVGEAAILAVVQLYRYRRVSSPLQRQQTKWVVFGMALPIAVFVSGGFLPLIFPPLAPPPLPR